MLVLVAALIVARPLVPGDDPGLLEASSGLGGLALNGLWLLTGFGWAAWRLWAGPGRWCFGLVDGALLGFAALLFAASAVAGFVRPALLTAWDALVVVLVFSLVRNLAGDPRVRRGLLAVFVATGVCVAAFGAYQLAIDLPRLHEQGDRDYLRLSLAERYDLHLDEDSPRLAAWAERLRTTTPFSTFDSPRTFACYLALVLPVLAGVVWTARRNPAARWTAWPLAACALLIAGLLVMEAIYGAASDWAARTASWSAALRLIGEHPWLGVGAANFGRQFAPSTNFIAWQASRGPWNFLLEAATAGGVAAGLLLLAAVGLWFWKVWKELPSGDAAPPEGGAAWEFYVGGMIGLLLGFALRVPGLPPGEILREGGSALVRSVAWFGGFGLAYHALRTGRVANLAVAAGPVVCLLLLLVTDGILAPALTQPLWTAAALAVPVAANAAPERSRLWTLLQRVLPPLALLALTALYLMLAYWAVTAAVDLDRVRLARPQFREEWSRGRGGKPTPTAVTIQAYVNGQLEDATRAEPLNPLPLLRRAEWASELGLLYDSPDYASRSLDVLAQTRRLDPLNPEVPLAMLDVHVKYAGLCQRLRQGRLIEMKKAEKKPEDARRFREQADELDRAAADHLRQAEALLKEIVERDPVEAARLHYRLAGACFKLQRDEDGRRHAREALEAHQSRPAGAPGELPPDEIPNLQDWLK